MKLLNKLWTVFLALLCVLALLIVFLIWQLNQNLISVSEDILQSLETDENMQAELGSSKMLQLYSMLYEQLDAYGLQDQYGKETTALANTLLDKSLKNYQIESIAYLPDGFLVSVGGTGISSSEIDETLLASAISKAAAVYLKDHLFSLASSLIQNDQEALKETVFKDLGAELFETLDLEIQALPETEIHLQYKITIDGTSWKVEAYDPAAE